MEAGNGAVIAAVFNEKRQADAALVELREQGFHAPWLAVGNVKPADTTGAAPGAVDATPHHAVVTSSDGVLGALGRFFGGDTSLRRSLEDHGLSETVAAEVDAALPFGGAVIVVSARERHALATTVLTRAGAAVFGGSSVAAPPPLVEAADTAASGTGEGPSTGYLSDDAARPDAAPGTAGGAAEHTSHG